MTIMKLKNIVFVVFMCMVSGCLSASINESFVELKNCNIYEGKWVYDESFPLFDSSKCSAIRGQFNCLKYGLPDHQFLKYRWQPNACNLPSRCTGQGYRGRKWPDPKRLDHQC
ncbi:hypothetical protein SASPL_101819 [Salvia splendens]|uniref:Trichome birefringence-like N-terminal domain-containing protein n=1 Tax=Salvia splendens TaxID=180675 RepID=A0A8X8YSI8_SALSN|nr:hypothetical protein SASPL_101819 [Salvia splendens]